MSTYYRSEHDDQITRLGATVLRYVPSPIPVPHRNTVLVIEDHQEVRNVLVRALRKAELDVVEADTAAAAREVLDSTSVDAVVTDIALPGSINGLELGNWIRFRFPKMPMVFITGLIQSDLPGAPVQDAFTRLVCKPFGGRLLVDHIRGLLAAAA